MAGDRDYRFSGGEKQRVALARLLLKAPSVVVLDEATAHLDSESEAVIQQALKTALAGRTSLVIAHRLSTVREAYQILVIDEGRVVERGNHQRLIDAGGLYAGLYRTQFATTAGSGYPLCRVFTFRNGRSGQDDLRRKMPGVPAARRPDVTAVSVGEGGHDAGTPEVRLSG